MHWRQWAYFHFNNTGNFFLILSDFAKIFVTEWKQYGDDQTAACFRSRLFCLSVIVTPERVREWESTMTRGNFSKTTPNHSVFLLLPMYHGDVSESSVCHSIPRQPLDPTTNWRLLSCHLLSLPCLGVLRWITHSFVKRNVECEFYNTERAMASIQLY